MQDDRYINFNWGSDSPFPGLIPPNDFSVRWTRSEFIPSGHYKVTLQSDDGARLWLNDRVIINNYVNPTLEPITVEVWSPGATADLRVDFFDRSQIAAVSLGFLKVPNSPGSSTGGFVVPGVPNIPPAGGSGGSGGSGGGAARWLRWRVWRRYKPDHPAVSRRPLSVRLQRGCHLCFQSERAPRAVDG